MDWDMDQAYRILNRDPVLKRIIKKTGRITPLKNINPYFSLLRSITCQQLSAKAGDTIFNRFLELFPGGDPHPDRLLKIKVEKLRSCGLSYAKAGYLKNIAEFSKTQGLDFKKLKKMEDGELMNYLTSIKGVGRWTAEMTLMFTLNRPDILPLDDIGIRGEMIRHYGLNDKGKQLLEKMQMIAEPWQPFRTLACRHLWRNRDQ